MTSAQVSALVQRLQAERDRLAVYSISWDVADVLAVVVPFVDDLLYPPVTATQERQVPA